MNKTVSIIIPCYNGERFADRCLESIVSQDYPYVEIIVVNDGSTDNSEDKILSWKNRLGSSQRNLIYIKQENQGSGAAVNTGLKHVTGDYISLFTLMTNTFPVLWLQESTISMNTATLTLSVQTGGMSGKNQRVCLFMTRKKRK